MFMLFSRSLFWKIFVPIGGLLILSGIAAMIFLPVMIRDNAENDAIAAIGLQSTQISTTYLSWIGTGWLPSAS